MFATVQERTKSEHGDMEDAKTMRDVHQQLNQLGGMLIKLQVRMEKMKPIEEDFFPAADNEVDFMNDVNEPERSQSGMEYGSSDVSAEQATPEEDVVETHQQKASLFVGKYTTDLVKKESKIHGKCTTTLFKIFQSDDNTTMECIYTGKCLFPTKMDGEIVDSETNEKELVEKNTEFRFKKREGTPNEFVVTGHGRDGSGAFRIKGLMVFDRDTCRSDIVFLKIYQPEDQRNAINEQKLRRDLRKEKRQLLKDCAGTPEWSVQNSIGIVRSKLRALDNGIKICWKPDDVAQLSHDFHQLGSSIAESMWGKIEGHLFQDYCNISTLDHFAGELKEVDDLWALGELDVYIKAMSAMVAGGENLYWSNEDKARLFRDLDHFVPANQQFEAQDILSTFNPHLRETIGRGPLEQYSIVGLHELEKFVETVKELAKVLEIRKSTMCAHCHEPLSCKTSAVPVCSTVGCVPCRMHEECWVVSKDWGRGSNCLNCMRGTIHRSRTRGLSCRQEATQERAPLQNSGTKCTMLGLLNKLNDSVSDVSLKRRVMSLTSAVDKTAGEIIHSRWGKTSVFDHSLFKPGHECPSTVAKSTKKRKRPADCAPTKKKRGKLEFSTTAPRIGPQYQACIPPYQGPVTAPPSLECTRIFTPPFEATLEKDGLEFLGSRKIKL